MMICFCLCIIVFFFKQKTAYEMRISDWSSDVCSSDLSAGALEAAWASRIRRGSGGAGGLAMRLDDYRVMKRPDKQLESAWGLWSEKSQSWLELLFPSEQSDREALDSDRKSVETGKSVSVRGELGGRRIIKNKTKQTTN